MIKTNNINVDNLLKLIRCAVKGVSLEELSDFDAKAVFKLAKKQQVYNLVLPVLQENNMLTDEQEKSWNNYYFSELNKMIILESERKNICSDLDENGVKYMFMKGLIVRDYYPKALMRQMSDYDLLYDESQWKLLFKVMKKNGFYLDTSSENSDDFVKDPYCRFEFHRRLFDEKKEFSPDFNPFLNAKEIDGTSRLEMSKEDNLIYTVLHMFKHFFEGESCGIRFVCDVYLIKEKDREIDFSYIERKLLEYGVLEFYKKVIIIADAVFGEGELENEEKKLLQIMFDGGIYGNLPDVDYKKEFERHGGRLGFLMFRLFPPKAFMKDTYRQLEEKPYLLGYYYIYRLFDKFVHSKSAMNKDINSIFKK